MNSGRIRHEGSASSLRPILSILLLCFAGVALSFMAVRQSRETRILRAEAAELRSVIRLMNTPQDDHKTSPKIEPDAEKQKALQENQAEAERLRTEIERLEAEIEASPKPPKSKNENPVWGSNFTLNQILEAARLGNTHRLAEFLTFDLADEAQAETLFAQLPSEIQAEYGSARHLVASVAALIVFPAETEGRKIVNQPRLSKDNNSITWDLEPRKTDSGPAAVPISCLFRPATNGDWLLVVSPEMMASYREVVAGALKKANR